MGEQAARRDASFYRSGGSSQSAYRFHIVGSGEFSACGRVHLLVDDAESADGVPEYMRCKRNGCKQRWPKGVSNG